MIRVYDQFAAVQFVPFYFYLFILNLAFNLTSTCLYIALEDFEFSGSFLNYVEPFCGTAFLSGISGEFGACNGSYSFDEPLTPFQRIGL